MKRIEVKMKMVEQVSKDGQTTLRYEAALCNGQKTRPEGLILLQPQFESLGEPEEITVTVYALESKKPVVISVKDKGRVHYEHVFECRLSNGKAFNFTFFDDELHFSTNELTGLTEEACFELKFKKDVSYLQS